MLRRVRGAFAILALLAASPMALPVRASTTAISPSLVAGGNRVETEAQGTTDVPNVQVALRMSRFRRTRAVGRRAVVEIGGESWITWYPEQRTGAAGVKAVARAWLPLRGVSPWVEGAFGAGGTALNVPEIRSNGTFVEELGVGVSRALARGRVLTFGVRVQHLSNGGVERPNRGLNSVMVVLGITFFRERPAQVAGPATPDR